MGQVGDVLVNFQVWGQDPKWKLDANLCMHQFMQHTQPILCIPLTEGFYSPLYSEWITFYWLVWVWYSYVLYDNHRLIVIHVIINNVNLFKYTLARARFSIKAHHLRVLFCFFYTTTFQLLQLRYICLQNKIRTTPITTTQSIFTISHISRITQLLPRIYHLLLSLCNSHERLPPWSWPCLLFSLKRSLLYKAFDLNSL